MKDIMRLKGKIQVDEVSSAFKYKLLQNPWTREQF